MIRVTVELMPAAGGGRPLLLGRLFVVNRSEDGPVADYEATLAKDSIFLGKKPSNDRVVIRRFPKRELSWPYLIKRALARLAKEPNTRGGF